MNVFRRFLLNRYARTQERRERRERRREERRRNRAILWGNEKPQTAEEEETETAFIAGSVS